MARIKRKSIELNEKSVKDLMQETYNDAHQIRSTIVALFNVWNSKVKEQGEIAATGKEIVSLINALARNQDQKIALMKVLSDIVFVKDKSNSGINNNSKSQANSDDNETLSEEAKNNLRKLIEEARERGEINV
jgi:hemoglobin-like flavoprotein